MKYTSEPVMSVYISIGKPQSPSPLVNNKRINVYRNQSICKIAKDERVGVVNFIHGRVPESKLKPAQLYYVVYNESGAVLAHSVNTPANMLKMERR